MISLRLNRGQIDDPSSLPKALGETPPAKSSAWDLRLISTVHHLLNEWTTPEMILGMGLGHVAWGSGRLLGCRLFTWAGIEGRAALWAGRTGGIFAEGGAWTAAGQLGRTLRTGQSMDVDLKREWLSTATLAASLRSAQGLFAGTGPLGLALATYGAVVLSDRALGLSGVSEAKTWSQTFLQSLVLFGGFHVSGLLAGRVWGSSLARMDRAFDAKIRQIQNSRSDSGGPFAADPLGEGFLPRPLAGLPAKPLDRSTRPFAMASDPKAESPGRYRSPLPPSSVEKPLGGMGTRENPWRVEDMTHLIESVTHPDAYFQFRILKEDVYFFLASIKGFSSNEIHSRLNGLGYLAQIKDGIKTQVRFENHNPKFEYIKFGKGFVLREGSTSAPPQAEMEHVPSKPSRYSDTARTLEKVRNQMDVVAARRSPLPTRPSSAPQMPAVHPSTQISTSPSTPTAKGSQPPLKMVETMEGLANYILALNQNGSGAVSGDIFVNRLKPLETEELFRANEVAKKLAAGSRIGIHDPQRHRSFNFTKMSLKIQGEYIPWEPPRDFDRFTARDLLEVLQKLSFLRGYSDPRKGLVIVDIRGRWRPWDDGGKMEKFLNVQIPDAHRTIQVHQDSSIQTFQYDTAKHLWVKGPWE